VRKLDWKVMAWAALSFSALNLDRSNITQANTDNFLKDLHLTTDGQYSHLLRYKELMTNSSRKITIWAMQSSNWRSYVPSSRRSWYRNEYVPNYCAYMSSKHLPQVGPDRWIPTQMILWSIVSCTQFWLTGRGTFLATRALLG
jgi:hypothetical protein